MILTACAGSENHAEEPMYIAMYPGTWPRTFYPFCAALLAQMQASRFCPEAICTAQWLPSAIHRCFIVFRSFQSIGKLGPERTDRTTEKWLGLIKDSVIKIWLRRWMGSAKARIRSCTETLSLRRGKKSSQRNQAWLQYLFGLSGHRTLYAF